MIPILSHTVAGNVEGAPDELAPRPEPPESGDLYRRDRVLALRKDTIYFPLRHEEIDLLGRLSLRGAESLQELKES